MKLVLEYALSMNSATKVLDFMGSDIKCGVRKFSNQLIRKLQIN